MSDDIIVVVDDEGIPVKTIEVGIQGPMGPPGAGGGASPRVELGAAGGVFLLWDVPANSLIRMVEIQVKVPYNDPLAAMTVGTDADPSFLPAMSKLQGTGVYQNYMDIEVTVPTQFKIFLNSAATVGSSAVLLNYIPK